MKSLSIILFVLFAVSCTQHNTRPASEPTLNYATWVFADEKAGADDIRKQYLDGAIKLATSAGMQEVQGFAAKEVLMGELLTPEFIGLFAWPNAEAARNVRESDAYTQRFGPLRTLGWDQLVAVDVNLPAQPAWQFEKGRYYTVALVWTKSAEAYQQYVTATAGLRETMGFSILYSQPVVSWSTIGLTSGQRAPDRLALLSWPDASVPKRYLEALSAEPYASIASGTFEGISWHEVQPY